MPLGRTQNFFAFIGDFVFILAQGALDIPLEPPGVGEERTNRRDHEVVGQRLTFPFPFVHQQPHDCGNKTINRWETSLWNLSYNLSAVNILQIPITGVGNPVGRDYVSNRITEG